MWLSTFLMDQLGYIWHDTSHNHLNINAKISNSYPCSLLWLPQTYGQRQRQRLYFMYACVRSSLGVTILSLVSAMNFIWHIHSWHSQEPCDGSWTAKIVKQTQQLNKYECTNCCLYCMLSKGNVIYEFGLWTKLEDHCFEEQTLHCLLPLHCYVRYCSAIFADYSISCKWTHDSTWSISAEDFKTRSYSSS